MIDLWKQRPPSTFSGWWIIAVLIVLAAVVYAEWIAGGGM
jgi:hypothetical protein